MQRVGATEEVAVDADTRRAPESGDIPRARELTTSDSANWLRVGIVVIAALGAVTILSALLIMATPSSLPPAPNSPPPVSPPQSPSSLSSSSASASSSSSPPQSRSSSSSSSALASMSGEQESPRNADLMTMSALERLPKTASADEWHTQAEMDSVLARIRKVAEVCGALCDTTRKPEISPVVFEDGRVSDRVFNKTTAPVDCDALLRTPEIDTPRETERAPRRIPAELVSEFTMQDRVPLGSEYHDQKYLAGGEVLQWTEDLIETNLAQTKSGKNAGSYGPYETNYLRTVLAELDLGGKRALVVGSERPWLESCLLEAGVDHVVTLEYSQINSTHPKVSAMIPSEFAAAYLKRELAPFDVVATYSSLEHPGLARYGDALNPWGDIISVAKMHCVTKPGGLVVAQVPGSRDQVVFNAHRFYGALRLPYLMANWDLVQLPRDIQRRGHGQIRVYRKPS